MVGQYGHPDRETACDRRSGHEYLSIPVNGINQRTTCCIRIRGPRTKPKRDDGQIRAWPQLDSRDFPASFVEVLCKYQFLFERRRERLTAVKLEW
jgi:hypothetical protein